ncbi:hypothetical protein Tco_1265004 [Tanacetum coccineum]
MPNEEPNLGYLKFSAKGTKQEVFRMPIPNDLITDDIRGEQYYNAYWEKVAKHQRYLAGEEVSDPDSPAPKPKATKQSNPLAPKAATKKPKPAPAKPQEKKCKLDTLANEFVNEGVLENEPRLDDEEAATQRAIEESLKEVHDTRQGPLPPVVFREPDSGKFQPLPEVQGKGKEKVSDEQVARDLLTLQKPKKKSPAEQYIFQKRTPATSEPSGLVESSSLYAELGLTDSETDSDEEVSPEMNAGAQEEGQDGTNPGEAAVSQTQSSHVMDEEFTTTIYPSVQENLKLPTKGEVRLEEPASSTGTLSSLQNLDKELSFTNHTMQKNYDKGYEDHKMAYEALQQSILRDEREQFDADKAKKLKQMKRKHDSPKTPPGSPPPPPPPPPLSGPLRASGTDASSSSKTSTSTEYTAWMTTDTRIKPSVSSIPEELHMDNDTNLNEQVQSSGDEDIGRDHILTVNLRQSWPSALASTYTPPPENLLLAQTSDIATFMDWFCKKQGITESKQQDLEVPAYKIVKVFHPNVIYLQYQMEECHKLLTDQVDEPIIRLEQMVPDQIWIKEECKYDIVAMYGISHWWFQRQRFYIDRHTSKGYRRAVRTHMRILSVV